MFIDNSPYKADHDKVVDYVKSQIGIDLNQYRDGDGTSPYTTEYWGRNWKKLCVNWCGCVGGMSKSVQNRIMDLVNKSNGKLAIEWGGAWFKYIYFSEIDE